MRCFVDFEIDVACFFPRIFVPFISGGGVTLGLVERNIFLG